MASIELQGIRKEYDNGFVAIDSLDLSITDGEFLVLVGPSGCGKSTALRMIAGLEEISAGELRIGDRIANHLSPGERDIAMVFQSYGLYPHMSVIDNIAFPLRLAKVAKSARRTSAADVAASLGLTEFVRSKPGQLSGGQRQRVAMGRAVIREPAAYLLDEPLSNLDAKLRVEMRAEIAALQARLGTTTVYVTHDQTEAMTMGDRVAVLRDGHLMQIATPQELYESPANTFVASFIGSPPMSLLSADLVHDGQGSTLDIGGQRLNLDAANPVRAVLASRADGPIIVGLRPEHWHPGSASQRSTRYQRLKSAVALVEALGSETIVRSVIDGARPEPLGDASGDPQLIARLDPQFRARAGERIELAYDSHELHFFDTVSGETLSSNHRLASA